MKNQVGFVLLSVLILMQITTLLSLSALDQVFLAQKLLSDEKEKRLLFNEAEQWMTQLAINGQEASLNCWVPMQAEQELRGHPLDWWSSYACTIKDSQFRKYYIVENLGRDPCALIRGQEKTQAAYYRLTVFLIKEQDKQIKVLLQSTVVTEAPDLEHCDRGQHSVDLGPQSWHQLI